MRISIHIEQAGVWVDVDGAAKSAAEMETLVAAERLAIAAAQRRIAALDAAAVIVAGKSLR